MSRRSPSRWSGSPSISFALCYCATSTPIHMTMLMPTITDTIEHMDHGHRDHNLRAAYLHVLADAVTSVMAIGGLILALWFGWPWIDAVVGLVGACVIARWSYGVIRAAGRVLLDMVPDGRIQGSIRQRLEVDGDRVADLHLWQIGPGHRAAIVTI